MPTNEVSTNSEVPAAETTKIKRGNREYLKQFAFYQKGMLLCILVKILSIIVWFFGVQMGIPADMGFFVSLGFEAVGLVSTVFVFLLAVKVFRPLTGIVLAILTFVPGVGLLVLFIINSTATDILRENRIKVGLFGARISEI